jgi:hypothetical protein
MVTLKCFLRKIKTLKTTRYSNYKRIWCVRIDIIAFQNPDGEWQVNAETLFVEILDENGTVLPLRERPNCTTFVQ